MRNNSNFYNLKFTCTPDKKWPWVKFWPAFNLEVPDIHMHVDIFVLYTYLYVLLKAFSTIAKYKRF